MSQLLRRCVERRTPYAQRNQTWAVFTNHFRDVSILSREFAQLEQITLVAAPVGQSMHCSSAYESPRASQRCSSASPSHADRRAAPDFGLGKDGDVEVVFVKGFTGETLRAFVSPTMSLLQASQKLTLWFRNATYYTNQVELSNEAGQKFEDMEQLPFQDAYDGSIFTVFAASTTATQMLDQDARESRQRKKRSGGKSDWDLFVEDLW